MKTPRLTTLFAPALLAFLLLTPFAVHAAEGDSSKKLTKNQERFDADKDGKLNDQEQAAAKQAVKEKAQATRKANLEKYDANKDGKLDDAEKAKMKADQEAAKAANKAQKAKSN